MLKIFCLLCYYMTPKTAIMFCILKNCICSNCKQLNFSRQVLDTLQLTSTWDCSRLMGRKKMKTCGRTSARTWTRSGPCCGKTINTSTFSTVSPWTSCPKPLTNLIGTAKTKAVGFCACNLR